MDRIRGYSSFNLYTAALFPHLLFHITAYTAKSHSHKPLQHFFFVSLHRHSLEYAIVIINLRDSGSIFPTDTLHSSDFNLISGAINDTTVYVDTICIYRKVKRSGKNVKYLFVISIVVGQADHLKQTDTEPQGIVVSENTSLTAIVFVKM